MAMANPIQKKIVKDGVTFQLTLTPDPKSNAVNVLVIVDHPSTAPGGADQHSATFKLSRDELTPLVMAFLLGG